MNLIRILSQAEWLGIVSLGGLLYLFSAYTPSIPPQLTTLGNNNGSVPTAVSQLWQKQYHDTAYTVTIGQFNPDGNGVWVSDPLEPRLQQFFPLRLPRGTFPVKVHLNPYATGYDIEGISIVFDTTRVTRWEVATSRQGQPGVWTDTGLIGLYPSTRNGEQPIQYHDIGEQLASQSYQGHPTDWCSCLTSEQPSQPHLMTGTGLGDGFYRTYIGFRGHRVVAFTVQFSYQPTDQPWIAGEPALGSH